MIDQNYRNERIRDLAERILFAGVSNVNSINDITEVCVADYFIVAREMIDHGIKNYPITDDECEDEEPDTHVQDSL
jgi:hypothetical protein